MYNDLRENWEYNEWPDVDLEGNIISEKKSAKLTESVECHTCPDCGKEICECGVAEELNEEILDEAEEEWKNDPMIKKYDVKESLEEALEEEDLSALKEQVREALDNIFEATADEIEEIDLHDLVDAVLAYFDKDDCIEYIRSCVCPEDEEGGEEEEIDDEDVADDIINLEDDEEISEEE